MTNISIKPVKSFKAGKLSVQVYADRESMGKAVAMDVAYQIREIHKIKNDLRMIFAAAPSQNEFLENLIKCPVEWNKISAFHMDEYLNISKEAPQSFGNFLGKAIFSRVEFKKVNLINSQIEDAKDECQRYANLINESTIDICAMGIGENGHLAFNDPPVANFSDPSTMKIVDLDLVCRQQQVNDGCFPSIDKVPGQAFTLTIPALLRSEHIFVTVPGKSKAEAVYKTINEEISSNCPSTILRNYSNAMLYIDMDAASLL
ncbi:MAG: glucosamine-6-phosphate deaminase [Bacteroidales bacterium]|nr:glucosamine-6-phosphate deaminase [Bacteroidales bacterium]MCF8391119.1 glucosamine-6-phosphate deaminase [Bacteroidales bacterium]